MREREKAEQGRSRRRSQSTTYTVNVPSETGSISPPQKDLTTKEKGKVLRAYNFHSSKSPKASTFILHLHHNSCYPYSLAPPLKALSPYFKFVLINIATNSRDFEKRNLI